MMGRVEYLEFYDVNEEDAVRFRDGRWYSICSALVHCLIFSHSEGGRVVDES